MRSRRFAAVDTGSEAKDHCAFGETTCQRVQQLPSHGGTAHRERGAPPPTGDQVRQDTSQGGGRLERRLQGKSNARRQGGVQSCKVGGVGGTGNDVPVHRSSPCRPAGRPVCCACSSHCMPVRFRGFTGRASGPGQAHPASSPPHRADSSA